MKIAVIILNWNGKSHLEKFLPGVIHFSNTAEIIVADNGSTDDSVYFLKKNFPSVKIIELSENTGFAGGYNKALQKVSADYYILLNSDAEVTENWISPSIELMKKDETIAAAQPKIKSFHDKEKFEYAGAAGGFIDKYGYPFCRGRIFETIETDNGQYNDEKEIFWATGACMFIRADLFHKAGGFDAGFFAHMEEIDLCWRLKTMGYKIFYSPHSTVYHVGGGTLHKSNPQKTFLNFRNNLWMLMKNLPPAKLLPVIFIRLLLDGIAGIKFLFTGNPAGCFAVIRAHFHFCFSLPGIFKKRKMFAEKKTPDCVMNKSLIWQYFILKKKHFSEIKMYVS